MNWLLSGILGMFFYGLFGIFNNFSTYQNPFQSNIIIQFFGFVGATVLVAYLIFARGEKIKFSLNAFLAGVFGATGTYFVLSSLMDNQLIVVYPFAAMSGLFFFILNYVLYKPLYSSKQFLVLFFGLFACISGIFLAAIGSSGGINLFLETFSLNMSLLYKGMGVMVCWGLLSFFFFRSRQHEKSNISSCMTSLFIASVLTAIIEVTLVDSILFSTIVIDKQILFPILSGLCMPLGSFFILNAFGLTKITSLVQNLIIAILTNGEIIPITIFAVVFLGQYNIEGIIGAIISIVGLTLINLVDSL